MNRRSFLRSLRTGGGIALVVGSAGCTSSGTSDDEPEPIDGTLVEMTDSRTFEPASVEVPAGETVVWRNVGRLPHSVTAYEDRTPADAAYFASGGFTSERAARDGYNEGALGGDDEYAHTFEVPGRYEYFCIPHERGGMTGAVIVAATSESTA